MHNLPSKDGDRVIDWNKTQADYTQFRPGPPLSFYARLAALGVGLEGQRILDLGSGTGVVARQFAKQGAVVTGIDVAADQLDAARQMAADEQLSDIDFQVAPAESLPWDEPTFDIATANQCWLYFDKPRALAELRRVLKPGGLLVTSHFCWLPELDPVARQSEELVLQFNPDWGAAGWAGVIPPHPKWAGDAGCKVRAMFYYDEPIHFTRESWRGRIRACRGVGASMTPDEVARFDAAHDELLQQIVPESFTILHRIDAHFFELP